MMGDRIDALRRHRASGQDAIQKRADLFRRARTAEGKQ
jgi:hypothetical protein